MDLRILVVDDDVAIRAALTDALRDQCAAEISEAACAEDAVALFDTEPMPDVILTDLRMRGLDGLDLLRIVRARSPGTRTVLMTAYHDVGVAVEAMREGASDFLCKPFDLRTLRDVLGRLLPGGDAGDDTAGTSWPAQDAPSAARRDASERGALLANRYRLEEEVGRGAMATVYRAHDRRHDRSVAVKMMRPEVATSIGVERFLAEIRIAARLQHPHVLTLIDSGQWRGVPYFVMPYIDGRSLRRCLCEDGSMEVAPAAALLRDIADALASAHGMGIVHRDVKPENVLLSERYAWVADFGIARALSGAAESGGTLAGALIGTPRYMAPEQAWNGAVDARADLYALGVVAYEMVAGAPPFVGDTAHAVLSAHLAEAPVPLARQCPGVPADFANLVMQCLNKEPADRPPDAGTLARSFGRFALERGR